MASQSPQQTTANPDGQTAGRSDVKQQYTPECEKAVNDQIHLELEAMYTYLSMANYFERHDHALPGFAQYFSKSAHEEWGHMELLAKYQNKRGGQIIFKDIKKPDKDVWGTGLEAMTSALEMEKRGNDNLIALHQVADLYKDYDLANFLEEHFLHEVVCTIKELADHITNLKRMKDGHGVYHFDRKLKPSDC